jgi:serine/threonine-protein kinase
MSSEPPAGQPQKLGHYILEQRIGAGGMGIVYRGRDERYGNTVAVKVIHSHLQAAPGYIERFRREAHIASMLTSPFVVKTLEFGQDQGQYFLVSEFVEGEVLSDLVRRGPLSDADATRIITEVALALDNAHGRGIVHRDLKPDNIMIGADGGARLMDFGVSHLAYLQGLTQTGAYSGSAAYSAPEQFDGTGDARSDIYSAGVVLFEMLAGRVPFQSPSLAGVMRAHQTEPPPLELIEGRSELLKIVVARSLAKDPQYRYQNASQMLAGLQGAQPGRSADDAQTTVLDRPAPAPVVEEQTVLAQRSFAPPAPPPPPPPPVGYAPAPLPADRKKTPMGAIVAVGAVVAIAIAAILLLSGGSDDGGSSPLASTNSKDSANSGTSATSTPSRSNPTPTPGRTDTIGRDIATPSRGNSTPTAANTPSTSGAVVKTTPTAAQRYPAALEKEFMDDCTGAGAGQAVCRCMLDILEVRYNQTAYRELEKAIAANQRQGELNAIVNACTR